jgi:hypothetical protein
MVAASRHFHHVQGAFAALGFGVMKLVGVVLALLIAVQSAQSAPRDDLSSPSQQKRDAAAATLRKTFKPTPRSKFERLLKQVTEPRMTKTKVLALLKAYKAKLETSASGGGGETAGYRLDDTWMIACHFSDRGDDQAFGAELAQSTQSIFVAPPKRFTGVWTTYYVNGQRSNEITYKDGVYDGTFTSFHDDGSKSVVQHYGPKGADGEDIGYHRAGQVAYRGTYKEGKQVGTWTWFDEAGKVTSTKQY